MSGTTAIRGLNGPYRVMTDDTEQTIPHRGAILGTLWLLTTLGIVRALLHMGTPLTAEHVRQGVDPNAAPWWELTLLPEIGPETARSIVKRRSRSGDPGFRTPIDLTRVRGIGPRTIERIGRHLRFDGLASPRQQADPDATVRGP